MRWLRLTALFAALLMLSACATRPSVVRPQAVPVAGTWSREHAANPAAAWWRALNDPQLDALIAQALNDSPDIAAVAARVSQARAAQAAARAARLPSVTLGAGAERQGVARRLRTATDDETPKRAERSQFSLDGQVAYELDWLGRNRLAESGASAQRVAAEQDEIAARITLIAGVVEAYADLAVAEQQRQIAETQVRTAADAEAVEQRRLAAGLANLRTLRERQDRASRAAQAVEDAARQHKQAADRLALLLGQPAHRYQAPTASAVLFDQPFALHADQPVDVIGRRPDVQAAWQRLLAATAESERAQLERYPRLSLTGSSGFLAETFKRWLHRDALGWVLGLRASVPLFDGGRLRAQAEQVQAVSEERQAEYRKTVLTALQEVESALTQFEFTQRTLNEARAAASRRELDERNARSELDAGRVSRLAVNDAQRAALDAREELVRAQRAHLQSYVLLRRVLADGV